MSTWQSYIDHAAALGYRVQHNPDFDGWTIIAPARPRRPSAEYGSYPNARAAWRGAAGMANSDD